ncbi:MAG TPA: glutathione S-transferase [Candidatus Binataceae bacterium]|nr:glutathione S-transferase [Candidatus Binataceae bacterium]
MLLYNSFGPNPRATRMFLLEKALTIPQREMDIQRGENRQADYLMANPAGQLPALTLDDGRVIAETVAIWEYLDEKHPKPPLIGSTPEDRAETRMWQRRVELNITENLYAGFRFGEGLEMFKSRILVRPEASQGLKAIAQDRMAWLDKQIAGRDYIVPNRFTIADIILYCATDFGTSVGQTIPSSLANLTGWFKRIDSRPSASASLHPASAQIKVKG